jgi:light-regulated signal transduction histidine kinase (bacteriophytochrome)
MIGVNIDIAERKEAEEQIASMNQSLQGLNTHLEEMVAQRTTVLHQLNTELQRSNQGLQDFAYIASHDLQEPLRKIQAFGNLLEDEYREALGDGKAYLDRMRLTARRMQTLINDLLTFSRVTTKAQPLTKVNLNIIAREVIEDLEIQVTATQAAIEIGPLPTIEADPLQMRQMLQNLIGNALKFHRPGITPTINVSAEVVTEQEGAAPSPYAPQSYCRLSVQDNGIGFDEKYLDRIFTVFQRLHGRNDYEGSGIGLAVVRKIVERHGGTITARSVPGLGSTFFVILPLTSGEKEEGSNDK